MSLFARRHGYGTDPGGDADRRAALSSAHLSGTDAERAISALASSAFIRPAIEDELRRQADRILADAKARVPRRPERPVADLLRVPSERADAPLALTAGDNPPVTEPEHDGHDLTERKGAHGVEVTCACGRWDGWYNGPRSRRFSLADHAHHVARELSAEPFRARSERVDLEDT